MSVEVDARGLACPQPVIATKKALAEISQGVVTTIVDNLTAKENVIKFAAANHCGVSVTERAGHYYIKITKDGPAEMQPPTTKIVPATGDGKIVYLITQNTLGHGSDELGGILMKSFLYTLLESQPLPTALLFINSGVKLTVTGSPVLEHLQSMASRGVTILACGTCLDYYQIKDSLAVGAVTNMFTIVETLQAATQAITV
jgi:selenium metabolism protein YedF